GATSGKITVTGPGGAGTSHDSFTVAVLLSLQSFTPPAGPAGMAVSVQGSGFTTVDRVEFDDKPALFQVVSDGELGATVASGARTGPIRIRTPDDSVEGQQDFDVESCSSNEVMELWPPNHKYVDCDLSKLLGDDASSVSILSITQDEPCGGECDG